MHIRADVLLQSLLLYAVADNEVDNDISSLSPKETPIPDPGDVALMARFIVHVSNWTSVAYISHQKGTEGKALADMFAVADGPVEKGSGIPYFYVSRLEAAVADILDNGNECSLTMGLASTPLCTERGWDPEDPRCAHVVLTGTFDRVDPDSAEYPVAQDDLFTRHPSFRTLPPGHKFFVGKYSIKSISLQDNFGGPVDVSVAEYFAVSNRKLGLKSSDFAYNVVPVDNWFY